MSNGRTNRRRGFDFEREIVNAARNQGLKAERAFGSNGRALGEAESVDVIVDGCRIQAKRRKALPTYLQTPDGCDVVAVRQDRARPVAIVPLSDFLDLIDRAGGY